MPLLGYIPSWKPAKAKASPKILDGLETFAKLIKEAQEMIAESKAKNKGKGVVKAWSIRLVDLYMAETNSSKVSLFRMGVFTIWTDLADHCKDQSGSCRTGAD